MVRQQEGFMAYGNKHLGLLLLLAFSALSLCLQNSSHAAGLADTLITKLGGPVGRYLLKSTDEGEEIFKAFRLGEAVNSSQTGLEVLAARIAARNPSLGEDLIAQIEKIEGQLLEYRKVTDARKNVVLSEALVLEERLVLKFFASRYLKFSPGVEVERLVAGIEPPVINEASLLARSGSYLAQGRSFFRSPPLTSDKVLRAAAEEILAQQPELARINEVTAAACSEKTAIAVRRTEDSVARQVEDAMARRGIGPPQPTLLQRSIDKLEETFGRMKECVNSQSADEMRRNQIATVAKQIGINEFFLASSYVTKYGVYEIPFHSLSQDMAMNAIKPIVLAMGRAKRSGDTIKIRYMRTLAFDAGFIPIDAVIFFGDPYSYYTGADAPTPTLQEVGVREAVNGAWTAGTFWKGPLFFDLLDGALCLWGKGSVRTKMFAQGASVALMAGEKFGFTQLFLYLRGHAMDQLGTAKAPTETPSK